MKEVVECQIADVSAHTEGEALTWTARRFTKSTQRRKARSDVAGPDNTRDARTPPGTRGIGKFS